MMKCREALSESVIIMVRYWVLVMKPPPEPEESGFRGLPGVTGELHPHLAEIARKNEHVRDALRGVNVIHPDWDDVYSYALSKYQQSYIRVMAFNYLRITIGDCVAGADDWLRPFLHAMCAYQESVYRQELGLPSALEESKGLTIVGLQYSSFLNLVMKGEEYPDVAWRSAYAESIAAGRLWVPKFAPVTEPDRGSDTT